MNNRLIKLFIGLGVVVAILLVKLYYIQIVNEDYYKKQAGSTVRKYIYPTRGIIYDRNGATLVGNKVAYDLEITPREVQAFDTVQLAQVLDTTVEFIREKMAYYERNRSRIGYQSEVMLKQIPPSTYAKFNEVRYKFPGFDGRLRSIRDYPVNAGGNLLGYVSEVDKDFMKKHEGYRIGDYAGRTGIEALMEEELRGEKGEKLYLRNSKNQIKASYKDGEFDKEAVPGRNIVTTIDAELQQFGQELMANKAGSVVAIEPKTGEILAMVSSPGIDVNQLAEIGKYYRQISSDPHRPMFNRAVQASYPPGSVFKLVNGLIGLEEGVQRLDNSYPCSKGFPYGGRKLGCHGHPQAQSLREAVKMSCNAYFCYVLRNILQNPKYDNIGDALDKWKEYCQSMGFGQKLGSDFPSELGGNLPDSKYYNKIYGKGGWKFTTILSISIGQGEVGATPLQLANLCATIANRGWYIIPHIIRDSENVRIDDKYREKHYTMVRSEYYEPVVDGMWGCVYEEWGTARRARVAGLDICGKTGTAQNPHGEDNSVFICFAPKDDPQIAVAAYVENAGAGGRWAAPIASLLVEKYLNGEITSPARKAAMQEILDTDLISR